METSAKKPWLPPRWFIRIAWKVHKGIYRITGGRKGLSRPTSGKGYGLLRLRSIGRKSGKDHAVMLSYFEDGDNLYTLAMNGWGDADPAWWYNLQAHPEVTVDTVDGSLRVLARAAEGEERERLWSELRKIKGWGNDVDAFATRRNKPTTVVVLEPRE